MTSSTSSSLAWGRMISIRLLPILRIGISFTPSGSARCFSAETSSSMLKPGRGSPVHLVDEDRPAREVDAQLQLLVRGATWRADRQSHDPRSGRSSSENVSCSFLLPGVHRRRVLRPAFVEDEFGLPAVATESRVVGSELRVSTHRLLGGREWTDWPGSTPPTMPTAERALRRRHSHAPRRRYHDPSDAFSDDASSTRTTLDRECVSLTPLSSSMRSTTLSRLESTEITVP